MTTSPSDRARPAGRGRAGAADWGTALGAAAVGVLVLYPLGALLLQAVLPHLFDAQMSLRPSLGPALQVWESRSNLLALANSAVIGLAAALVATAAGTLTAFGAFRAPKVVRSVLDGLVWGVFLAPSYVIAEGWLVLLQDGGIAAQVFHLHNGWSAWFFTRYGLAVVMGLRYFPFVHMAVLEALGNVGGELVQAGRLLGASRSRVYLWIVLPLVAPAWLAGASIAFAEGVGDFGLAAAITPQLHMPLLPYQIYVALGEAPVNYAAAAALSLLELAVTSGALALQMGCLRRRAYHTVSSGARAPEGPTRTLTPTAIIAMALAAAALLLPTGATLVSSLWKNWSGGLAATNWTLAHYRAALAVGGDGALALGRSLEYALIAGAVVMALGVYIAHTVHAERSRLGAILNLVIISTIAVPGVVLAAGFVFAWNARWLIPIHLVLYGTPVCLGMAYIAGSLPYAIRLQIGAMSQLSPNLTTAARLLGATRGRILRQVIFPLVRGMAVSTFFITFCGVMFELPASALLYPPGAPPFPVEIQSKFDAFQWAAGSALSIIGMVVVMAAYVVGRSVAHRLSEAVTERETSAVAASETARTRPAAAG